MILNEVELKYRTEISQETFEDNIYPLTKGFRYFDLHIKYKDCYYYYEIAGCSTSFMRYREDEYKSTLTFKEELIYSSCIRKEVNIDKKMSDDEVETLADILGFNQKFSISKEAIVVKVPQLNSEFCWYEVNENQRFLEVEMIGDVTESPEQWLKTTDKVMKDTFGKEIKRENKSLFSIYKPKNKFSRVV